MSADWFVADGASNPGQDAPAPPADTTGTGKRFAPQEPAATGRPFGSTVGWTIFGAIIPGVGLLRAKHKVAGGIVLGVFVLLICALVYGVAFDRNRLIASALQSSFLMYLAIGLLVLGLAWVVVITVSHLALRAPHPPTGRRVVGAVVVGVLCMAVMAPMAMGANLAYTSSNLLSSVFGSADKHSATVPTINTNANPVDPWASKPVLNIALLGGDSGTGRPLDVGARTDSVAVLSINTETGYTTIISLPRQTARMPFPPDSPLYKYYPNGFYDGHDATDANYFLNAMYRMVPLQVPKDVLGTTSSLGADAVKISIGYALGIKIDYYVMINMDGFQQLINAIGGVTVNVNYKVPIGGVTSQNIQPNGWINPGPNEHLNGYLAMWYARGRFGLDDYSRMERQRCVINALAQQASPQLVLTRYESIATASEQMIATDIPQSILPALVTLATRVKGTTMGSVVFQTGKNGFVAANPNFDLMRTQVAAAIQATATMNQSKGSASASPSASASASPTASPSTKAAATNVTDACAYNPQPYNSSTANG